jgi:hypothetical protein
MSLIPDPDPALSGAQLLSARLVQIVGGLPPTRSQPTPGPHSSPLSAVLEHLGRRPAAAEHAADKLKANEFMVGA